MRVNTHFSVYPRMDCFFSKALEPGRIIGFSPDGNQKMPFDPVKERPSFSVRIVNFAEIQQSSP